MEQRAPLSDADKKALYDKLSDALINGLLHGFLFEDDSKESATVILDSVEKLQTRADALAFLKRLSDRWDAYREVYMEYKKEELLGTVQAQLNQLQ